MFSKNTFDNLRLMQRIQSAQVELSSGWKNLTEKAKKEVKVANKIARKVLATEDGGELREEYILKVKLDSGYQLFKKFHNEWVCIHEESVKNVKLSEKVDEQVVRFNKEWEKWNTYLIEFQNNLQALPEFLAKVEIAQNKISAIGELIEKIETLLVEYEDAIERHDLEKQKLEVKVKLSELVATKHAEFALKKSMYENQHETTNSFRKVVESKEGKEAIDRQQSEEKQKAYGDVFLEQMSRYIQYGEIEKPIASFVQTAETTLDDIQINESDLSTLREFLGPEEIDSVIQAQASQNRKAKEVADLSTISLNSFDLHLQEVDTTTEITLIENPNGKANVILSKGFTGNEHDQDVSVHNKKEASFEQPILIEGDFQQNCSNIQIRNCNDVYSYNDIKDDNTTLLTNLQQSANSNEEQFNDSK
uniref:Dysbindin n=1 Tax=Hydra vulgaris TaxID=6087 RepID=T2M878_HYDVU